MTTGSAVFGSSQRATAGSRPRRRIVIVDDHPIVRQGLRRLIEAEPDLEVCGEAETARGYLRRAHAVRRRQRLHHETGGQ